ncbi:class I SAM-dependent methyltransferase [Oerskovia sp. M15]
MLPVGARHVLDLAAGTGKLTERLVARGLHVTAVEPSDGMRAQLQEAVPGAHALPGTAERIPLDDGSVDAVLVAQAWHWFDVATAVPEIARVLRPGPAGRGVERPRPHGRLGRAVHRGHPPWRLARARPPAPEVDETFTPLEHATFPWADHLPPRPCARLRRPGATS